MGHYPSSCLPWASNNTPNLQSQSTEPTVPAFKTKRSLGTDTSHPLDFHVTVSEDTIPVHRNVLEESSHYFSCMFECGIQEAQTGTLEVQNTPLSVVRTAISYMYGEDISIEWDDVVDYIDLIEMWQLKELKDELEDYIVMNIDINASNWMHWFCIARKYHMRKVEQKIHLPIDAVSRLQICMNTIRDDKTTMEHIMDILHTVKLTKCSTQFMEVVLTIYKNTLRAGELMKVEPYMSMLSQMCRANNLGVDWDLQTQSEDVMDKELMGGSSNHRDDSCNGHTVIAFKPLSLGMEGGEAVIVRLNINKELSEISVKEISSCPVFTQGFWNCKALCPTPYGIFSCGIPGEHIKCTLIDIPSLNNIHLPDIDLENAYQRCIMMALFVVCVNNTVYVIYCLQTIKPHSDVKRHIGMRYLCLWNPTNWCSCAPVPKAITKKAYLIAYACAIGTRIYVLLSSFKEKSRGGKYHLSCYDTTNNTWSDPSQPPGEVELGYRYCRIIVSDSDILMYCKYSACAKYSTVEDQWTFFPRSSLVAIPLRDSLSYLDRIHHKVREKLDFNDACSTILIKLRRSLEIPLGMDCMYPCQKQHSAGYIDCFPSYFIIYREGTLGQYCYWSGCRGFFFPARAISTRYSKI